MPTTTDDKSDRLNPSQAHTDDAFNKIASNNPDLTAKGDQIAASHRDGTNSDGLKDAETKAEGKEPLSNPESNPEKSWYNKSFPKNKSFGGRAISAFRLASPRKKAAGIGGITGIIIAIMAFFSFLGTFQLVHLAQMMSNVFDGQSKRVLNNRARMHYKIVFDEDGKGVYRNTTLRGRLAKGYSSLDPQRLINDLKASGYDLSVDRTTGKVLLNGKVVDGKVSDTRNRVSEILDAEYPQDGFIKRSMRAKTAFRAMGIQRVFFFENTRRKFATWELEMISRMRERLGFGDSTSNIKVVNNNNNDGTIDTDTTNTAQLIDNLQDPSYDPGTRVTPSAPDISSFDPGKIGVGAISATGWVDAMCEVKYILKGTELVASVIRHQALVRNAGAFLVAAHQIKTGEGVDAAQVGGLMTLLNRKPGLGSSGSYQMLSGDPSGAKSINIDKYGLKFTSGYGGFLSTVNEKADSVLDFTQVGPGYCKLSRNIFYQITTGVAGVAIVIGGTASGVGVGGVIAKTVGQVAAWGTVELVANYVSQLISFDLAGPAAIFNYAPSQGGDEIFDGVAGGNYAISKGESYQNGMTQKLTTQEVATLENKIAVEKAEKLKKESLFNKYFALSNVDSFLSRQLASVPVTTPDVGSSILANVSNLPKKFTKSIELMTPQGSARAATVEGNPYIISNPLSIPAYGMTDSVVNEINTAVDFDPVANEEWIYDNGGIEEYQAWVNTCYPTDPEKVSLLYGLPSNEDEENIIDSQCSFGSGNQVAESTSGYTAGDEGYTGVAGAKEKYLRYATYRMDRSIQQGILFLSGQTECINPDSEEWDCINEDESLQEVKIRAGTLNVLGNQHTEPGGKLASWPSGANRIVDAMDIVKKNNLSVVGLQELEPEQWDRLSNIISDKSWAIFPEEKDYSNFRSSNSIIWNTSVFEEIPIESGFQLNLEYLGGSRLDVPWVKLKHKTSGQVVYIKNTHDPVDIDNVQYRINNSVKHLSDASVRIAAGDKVILLGDFNSNGVVRTALDGNINRSKLSYCIITENEKMQNTYDTSKDIRGQCPTSKLFSIDHIYTSADIQATSWDKINNLENQEITDHPLVYSDLVIAKINTNNQTPASVPNAEGWSWPIDKDTRISSCFNQRIFHPVYKQYMYHPGMDFGGDRLQIYAANAGVVVKAGGDSQNTIVIKHEGGIWSVYEHLSKIDVKVDDVVTSGQPIGLSGNVGYSTGPHLHFGITKDPGDYFYATMGKGKLYNPLVFINNDQPYKQCSIDPRIK